jgi:TrmH family RNA methyltransferase
MLSKNSLAYYKSLHQKKYRLEHNAFLVEGEKIAQTILQESPEFVKTIVCSEDWASNNPLFLKNFEVQIASSKDFERISQLVSPPPVLLELNLIENKLALVDTDLVLLLEGIRDPGNMGTIIRLADWFGIKQLVLSEDCVDLHNSKTVQSTMGSLLRMNYHLENLPKFIETHQPNSSAIIHATSLNGLNLYAKPVEPQNPHWIIIGSESHGISSELEQLAQSSIKIPSYGQAESLNVGVATGIICAYFRQQLTSR